MSKLVRRGTKLPKSEVHNATKRGNLKELAKLLKSKKGYTVEDRSPKSHLAIVKELLRKFRVNINALDNKKRTPLHLAIQYGHHEIALLLISKQANVSLQDVDGNAVVHWLLLHRPSVEWNAETAALLDTYHLILEQIIASSPSCLEIPNILGHTPLHIAVTQGNRQAILILLKNGADPNQTDLVKDTCLHIAFEKENKEVISILLEHGALVHISGAQGKSFQELVNSCPDPKKKELYTSLIQKSHEKLAKMERSLSNDIVADDGSSGESMMGSSPTNSSKGGKGSKKGTLTSSTSSKRERTISTRRYSGGKVSSPYPDKRKLGLFTSKTADRTGLTQSRSTESFSSLSAIQAQARELNSASPPSPRVLAANSVLTTQQQAKYLHSDKKGWLKKYFKGPDQDRGKFKKPKPWHKRYCVLRGNVFLYYKNSQSTTSSEFIALTNFTIQPMTRDNTAIKPNELKRFSFSITPIGADKTAAHYFAAKSEEEMLAWIEALNEAKDSDVTSDDLPEVEFADWSESKKLLVTTVIIKCVEYLQKEDKSAPPPPAEGQTPGKPILRLQLKGLFVKQANPSELRKIKASYDQIEDKIFNILTEIEDPYTVAQFLLEVLKEIPAPLLTYKLCPSFFNVVKILDPAERVRKLQELLAVIPTDHLSRLKCLLPFLCQLEQHKSFNDLSYEKIVDLFGITFVKKTLRVEEEGRKDRLALMDLLEFMIKHHMRLFDFERANDFIEDLEEEFMEFQRFISTDGMLGILGQEVEDIKLRWSDVEYFTPAERKWQADMESSLQDLSKKVTEEERACELMKKKIETALEDARGIIDFVEPSWDFTD